jgi:DNA repair protein RecN (Recombination protein N)
MLTTLRIKNLALVPDLTLELEPGYNAITGETGAGKSILIGALNLVLGGRGDRTLIRHGADQCTVEAAFDVNSLRASMERMLESVGLEMEADGQLLVKRVVASSGSGRQYVNGSPTSLTVLASLGDLLVDIHGPNDHQSLLQPSHQLAMLDAFGSLESIRNAYETQVQACRKLKAERQALIVDEQSFAQQLDLLRFQVQEIKAARLQPGEDQAIEHEFNRAQNAARLAQLCQSALDCLSGEEQSIQQSLAVLGRVLQDLGRLDPGISLLDQHHRVSESLQELHDSLSRYSDKIEIDPARLQELEDRLNLLHSLRRKYGTTLAEVIQFGNEAETKLGQWEKRDEELARINNELAKMEDKIWEAGQKLSRQRHTAAPRLAKSVTSQLADLGFKQSHFEITLSNLSREEFQRAELPLQGLDRIEFVFAPNPGEPPRPLKAIASSGELARTMLALKTVLAAQDSIPVLVFDEVDANIGGETAGAVGNKMRQIGLKRQVLCVTHLAPVAACASVHFVAAKQISAQRTVTEIRRLVADDRITEIARMLGGQSETARDHARALLENSPK